MNALDGLRIDRTALSVGALTDAPDDVAYWRAQPAEARWQAVEILRQINHGPDYAAGGLRRVLEIAERERR